MSEPVVLARRKITAPKRQNKQSERRINRPGCIARLRELWQKERDLGYINPPREMEVNLDTLSDHELVVLGKHVAKRVTATALPESEVMVLVGQQQFVHARVAAEQDDDPQGALRFVDDAERIHLIEETQKLWQGERTSRWLNPVEEVAEDLEEMPLADLRALRQRIADRVTFLPEESRFVQPLPAGWYWITPWQAWHPIYGETSIYTGREDALREVLRRMPSASHTHTRGTSDGGLFEEPEEPAPEKPETDLFGQPISIAEAPRPSRRYRRRGINDFD